MEDSPSYLNDPAVRYMKANEGITKSDFISIASMTGLNLTEFSSLLPVSKRTIEKVKEKELLSPQVSDRVLQVSALYQHGVNVLGDIISFKDWLSCPLMALGGEKPISFINNDTGISIVGDLLGRIEHGVYS
ncbi:MAG: putative toxin-antitoxin system antitoxin component (TIGR02293 family) [Cyclobacteriaceae bacterium]